MSKGMRARPRATALTALVAALAAMLVAGCGSGESDKAATGAGAPAGGGAAAAAAAVEQARERDTRAPDDSPRPAVKGKQIAIVSITMANESGALPSEAVADAARELGWEPKIYDAKAD